MYHHHYSNIEDDFFLETTNSDSQDAWTDLNCPQTFGGQGDKATKPLREKNSGGYRHVPHSEKPPQVVAKRNARERRRVQAVNNAFVKLRNIVPIQNVRGKRISKVKTLLYAIDYIKNLDSLLRNCGNYTSSYERMDYGVQKDVDYDDTASGDWGLEKHCFASDKYFN